MSDSIRTIPADAIAELDARFAALAAEIAQDDRPEPEPPAGGATAKRSRYDNLTFEERQRLYDATAYTEMLDNEVERARRSGNRLGVVIAELDDFTAVTSGPVPQTQRQLLRDFPRHVPTLVKRVSAPVRGSSRGQATFTIAATSSSRRIMANALLTREGLTRD